LIRLTRVAAVLFVFAFSAFSQSDRGTLTGTVSDPTGAVVAGAPIEARNVETGAVYKAASTGAGNYTLAQLPAGNYEMTVVVLGFKRFIRQNIELPVAQTLRTPPGLAVIYPKE